MKKAFISIVISRLPVQLGGCQRILRCARDRLEPLSLLPLQLTLSVKKKRCTVIMHSFDLYCTALHSCVCIVQIILCILVHCALRLTMANYSHCRQHASTGAPFQAVKQWEASPNAPSRLTVGIPQPGRGGDSLKICQNQNLNVFMVKCEEKWPLSWI